MGRQAGASKFSWPRRHLLLVGTGLFCVCAVILYFAQQELVRIGVALQDEKEQTMLMLFPSAQRALSYGTLHFDATNAAEYDIGLAEYYFQYAAAKDPSIPYVYHELARISFLQGNLTAALAQIDTQISMHGDSEPKAYYVRGLIEGYMGDYTNSATDYAHFLEFEPNNWAAKNDEAWVLLKAGEYQQALRVVDSGLSYVPSNAWLLNSKATALFELGDYQEALMVAQNASTAVSYLTPEDWSVAYPGNDPAIADQGLAAFKQAVANNMHTIELALATSTVQY